MKNRKFTVEFSLPISILKEGKSFVAYTPALDISTVGNTFEEARKRFEEMIEIFFEELTKKGTLEEVLLNAGWQIQNETLVPPMVISHEIETFSVPQSQQTLCLA